MDDLTGDAAGDAAEAAPADPHGPADAKPQALAMLSSERPRNLGWFPAGAMLFGDWGTSRLYVLGLAFLVAGRTSIWLILMMSLLILAVGWAYTHICRLYPDGGGVYTAGKRRGRVLGVVCALLLFADYTITASLSSVEAFHYFGLGESHAESVEHAEKQEAKHPNVAAPGGAERDLEEPSKTDKDLTLTPGRKELTPAEAGDRNLKTPVQKEIEGLETDVVGKPGPPANPSKPTPLMTDPGSDIVLPSADTIGGGRGILAWPPGPALYAILAIAAIGAFNLLGPKHTAGYAIVAAVGMVIITLLTVGFAVPQIRWSELDFGTLIHPGQGFWEGMFTNWQGFVYIVLALSGVEAIANLTGVMKKPVFKTASKSIWVVATEVAIFNLLLAVAMIALATPTMVAAGTAIGRESHKEDMLAYMAQIYIGNWGEWLVRIVAGVLLLSATNTAINGLMSIIYVMSRDGEMPAIFQKLNAFGSPWVGAMVAAAVPASVLLFFNDLNSLAALYAIGVVAAVAIDCTLAGIHPRLRRSWRKTLIILMGLFLAVVWVTLAFTKIYALVFVAVVMVVGLSLRWATQIAKRRRPRPTLLRQAIIEQLDAAAFAKRRFLLATAGGTAHAESAVEVARDEGAALVVAFVREVALGFRQSAEQSFTLDTDPAAEHMFTEFLELGHRHGVPIIPAYDTGTNTPEIIAETAALNGVEKVLIGSSRRGALHQIIKGSFQRKLEGLLPEEIPVQVLDPARAPAG